MISEGFLFEMIVIVSNRHKNTCPAAIQKKNKVGVELLQENRTFVTKVVAAVKLVENLPTFFNPFKYKNLIKDQKTNKPKKK